MAGLRGHERDFHGLGVADFAEQDDVRDLAVARPAAPPRRSAYRARLRAGSPSSSRLRARNSMGSSMVTMCIAEVWFMCPIIDAKVELLPLPAAPTTKTSPRLCSGALAARRRATQALRAWGSRRDDAQHRGEAAALAVDIDPEPAEAGDRISGVELGERSSSGALGRSRPRSTCARPPPSPPGRCVDAEVDHVAADARPRWLPHLDVDVARPPRHRLREQLMEERLVLVGAGAHEAHKLITFASRSVGIAPASTAPRRQRGAGAEIAGARSAAGSWCALRGRGARLRQNGPFRICGSVCRLGRSAIPVIARTNGPLSPGSISTEDFAQALVSEHRASSANGSAAERRQPDLSAVFQAKPEAPPAPSRSARRASSIGSPSAAPATFRLWLAALSLAGARKTRWRRGVGDGFVAPRHEARHKRRVPKVVARRRSRARCIVRDKAFVLVPSTKRYHALSFVPDVLTAHRLGHLT